MQKQTNIQTAELHQKLAIERKVLSGASAMLGKLVDENARQTCQVSVIDSQRRIDFLESELSRLSVGPAESTVFNYCLYTFLDFRTIYDAAIEFTVSTKEIIDNAC
jgi:hypothetical protein